MCRLQIFHFKVEIASQILSIPGSSSFPSKLRRSFTHNYAYFSRNAAFGQTVKMSVRHSRRDMSYGKRFSSCFQYKYRYRSTNVVHDPAMMSDLWDKYSCKSVWLTVELWITGMPPCISLWTARWQASSRILPTSCPQAYAQRHLQKFCSRLPTASTATAAIHPAPPNKKILKY